MTFCNPSKWAVALSVVITTLSTLAPPLSAAAQIHERPNNHVGADSLASITTDTGAFAHGNRDFSRFTVPGMCVAAVHQEDDVLRRTISAQYDLQLLRDTAPERDTLPAQAVALARACGGRFTIARTAPSDLPALFTLALQMGNDRLAQDVVRRQLASAPSSAARQTVLATAVQGYVDAKPARLVAAERTAATADTLALREHTNSLPAHFPMLELANHGFDRPRMRREADRLITLGQTLTFSAIQYYDLPLIAAWSNVLHVVFYEHPDSVLTVARRAKADLSRFPIGRDFPAGIPYSPAQTFDFKTHTDVDVRDFLLPITPDRYSGPNALPRVVARYWFPKPPDTWPPRGKVSLVLYGGWPLVCSRGDGPLLAFPMSNSCDVWHTTFPAWMKEFEARGFAITVMERARGEAVRSIPLAEAAEADSLDWYYRTYLKLPLTLGVVPTARVRQFPEPDGRYWLADTTAFGRMLGAEAQDEQAGMAMLYDRDGTLLYAGEFTPAILRALIARAITTPVATGSAPPTP
jgi:hypothetical protein